MSRMPLIVAVSGYARAGKDTFGDALFEAAEVPCYRYKFASALRNATKAAMEYLNLYEVDLWTEDDVEKALQRPMFVEIGKYARHRNQDVFAQVVANRINADFDNGIQLGIVTDLRYKNEDLLLRALAARRGFGYRRIFVQRGNGRPANDEEAQSIKELNAFQPADLEVYADDGDVESVRQSAIQFKDAFIG